jgi:hypothetical protein
MVAFRNLIQPFPKSGSELSLADFYFPRRTIMPALIAIALLVLGWALWFLIEFIRYVVSGEYELDKRLRNISR